MALKSLIQRGLAGVSFTLLAFALGGCSLKLAFGEPDLPDSGAMTGPVTYRDLSTIPLRPSVAPQEENQEALDSLHADRAATAEAADRLRSAPFDMPEPAPPPVEITP